MLAPDDGVPRYGDLIIYSYLPIRRPSIHLPRAELVTARQRRATHVSARLNRAEQHAVYRKLKAVAYGSLHLANVVPVHLQQASGLPR